MSDKPTQLQIEAKVERARQQGYDQGRADTVEEIKLILRMLDGEELPLPAAQATEEQGEHNE